MSKKIKRLRKLTAKANERVMAAEQEFINCQNEFEILALELKEAVSTLPSDALLYSLVPNYIVTPPEQKDKVLPELTQDEIKHIKWILTLPAAKMPRDSHE